MLRHFHIPIAILLVLLCGTGTGIAQIAELPQPDTTRGTFFGAAVAIEGNLAVVGASSEDSCASNAGAAYVFERTSETGAWERTARLVPSDCQQELFFGRQVALSGDRILVSASREFFATRQPSAAYIFERTGDGSWHEAARLTGEEGHEEGTFGASVDLDGNRALVTTWGDASQGRYNGAAYVYDYDPDSETWIRTARLTVDDDTRHGIFGGAAALDGDRVAVTASSYFNGGRGSIHIFEYDHEAKTWQHVDRIRGIDDFFISIDLQGPRLLIGESRAGNRKEGIVRIINRGAHGRWHRNGTLHSPRPYREGGFGTDVALHGDWALVVGYDEQFGLNMNIDRVVFAYRFDVATREWRFEHVVDIGAVDFGASIDLHGTVAIIGRASEERPGAAYVTQIPHPSTAAAQD